MKVKELRELSVAELQKRVGDMRSELLQLRLRGQTGGKLEKPHRVGELKRDIARASTLIGEKNR